MMRLLTEDVRRIEEFDQQRKARPAPRDDVVAQEIDTVIRDQFVQRLPSQRSIDDHTRLAGPVADFPRLRNPVIVWQILFFVHISDPAIAEAVIP